MNRYFFTPSRRRRWRACGTAVLGGLLFFGPTADPAAAQGYEPLRPIETRGGDVGTIDSASIVQYNEYSGNVSLDLSVGVDGLSLPIRYNSQSSKTSLYYPGGLGSPWHVGYGILSAATPQPFDDTSREPSLPPTNYQKVFVREAGGVETEFVPDYLFQITPPGEGWYNYHYIDRSLRRIERTIDQQNPEAHTAGNYILLNRDGSRVRYEPRDDSGVFYPVELTQSNGRKIFLSYRDSAGAFPNAPGLGDSKSGNPDPVLSASAEPLLERVSDEWGRSLSLHYELRPLTGERVVHRVSLDAPGQTTQDLATFGYTEVWNGTELETLVSRKISPEGHTLTIDYAAWDTLLGTPIERVTLPTGGTVDLTHAVIVRPICPYQIRSHQNPDVELEGEWLARVESLAFAGQEYTYSYQSGQLISDDHDGSWVVRRISLGPTQAENHERLTQYHHEKTRIRADDASLCNPLAFPREKARLAGQPIRRLTSVGGPAGSIIQHTGGNFTFLAGGTHRRQEWAYELLKLYEPTNFDVLRTDVFHEIPVTLEYAEKRDAGVWGTRTDRLLTDGFMDGSPFFDLPAQVTVRRTDDAAHRQIQTFDRESRVVTGHDLTTSIVGQPHVIGLVTRQTQIREILGEQHVIGRTDSTFTPGLFPQIAHRVTHTGPDATEEETMAYYGPGHTWHGLLEYRAKGPQSAFEGNTRTTFEAYQFGKASRIQPPAGPAIERTIRGDGRTVAETEDGIYRVFDYDDDRRPTRRSYPGSAQHDEVTEYSAPGEAPKQTHRIGSRTMMIEARDPWGRPLSTEVFVDATTSGLRSTHYDALGRIAYDTNTNGARRYYEYDMLGRHRRITVYEGAPGSRLLAEYHIQYRAQSGGRELHKTTLWRIDAAGNRTSDYTIQESETNLFGDTIRAGTTKLGQNHQTTISHRFVDGRLRALIQPGGGTDAALDHAPRLREIDWLGRTTLECHPEHGCGVDSASYTPLDVTRTVRYHFDALGRMTGTDGPGSETTRITYDALDRVLSVFGPAQDGSGELVRTNRYQYDPTHNGLTVSEAYAGESTVIHQLGDFDALQRPREAILSAPLPIAAPHELSPTRYWLFGDEIPLRFEESAPVDRYVVELQRLGALPPGIERVPILSFETPETELVLDDATIRAAVADLAGIPGAGVFLTDLDADPDFLLDPAEDTSYRWRVYGWKGDEPTLSSAWTPLDRPIGPDDCYFDHFRVRDGVAEGALLEWSTRNCSETGPLRVRMSTRVEHPDPACSLEDALFAAETNGPRRALFMVTGWDMDNGAPALPADPNAPQCAPVEVASFRGVIEDADGVEVHAVGPATGRVLPGGVCDVRNVNIIDGLGGTAPVVRWETQDCEDHTVEVLAEAVLSDGHPNPAACTDVGAIASGPSGQTVAQFMLNGYTGAGGVACGGVHEAWFRVRTTSPDNAVFESTPVLAFVEPEGGLAGCYTRLFTESSGPGLVPIIGWETRGCEGYDVEITRTSVGVPQDLRCLVRHELWDTSAFGARDARFMVEGYEGAEGVWCDPVAELPGSGRDRVEFDFVLNLRDPQTNAFVEPQDRIKKTLRATYTQQPAGSPHGPCRIDYFAARNGVHGTAPVATWGTSGDCQDVRLKVYTDPMLEPSACRLNGEIWNRDPDGPIGLHFMVGGYDYGFVDNYDDIIDCRGEPGGNGTYGEALRFAYLVLEAEGPSGTVRAPEDGSLPVRNHNDQLPTELPGPNDPCTILDFYVHQPSIPGLQPTDSTPVVHWRTNCPAQSRYSVQVLADTRSTDNHPYCSIDGMPFSADKNGPRVASFLRTGWYDYVTGGLVCEGRTATFRLQIVDTQTNQVLPGEVRDPITVFYSGPISGTPGVGSCAGGSCTATTCDDPENPEPLFDGLQTTPSAGADCQATLSWNPGQSTCGNSVTYRVYRGSHAGTFQSPSFLYATNITGTSFTDYSIVPSSTYYYVVSAVDSETGVESDPTPPVRLQNGCTSATAPFRVVPDTIEANGTTTLTWDIPDAVGILIVGIGDFPPSGSLQLAPSATTTYQGFAEMSDGLIASFTATVTVQGDQGPAPVAGGVCDRPCSDSVVIGTEEYFCRGFTAWGDDEVEQEPVWLAVSEWPDYVLENNQPISPYCLKAVCGSGPPPPNRWHVPSNEPASWLSDANVLESPELAGDGMDNDCDAVIDEIGN